MHLRLASIADAEQIREIYNLEVVSSTATFDLVERTLEEQRDWLSARTGAFSTVVATDGDRILGYTAFSPYRDRAAYRTTVENSVYVRRDAQRLGVGRALMTELIAVASAQGFHAMIARIERSNQASVQLHEAVGFTVVGTETEVGRKFNRWLDVVIMQHMLGHTAEAQARHERPEGRS